MLYAEGSTLPTLQTGKLGRRGKIVQDPILLNSEPEPEARSVLRCSPCFLDFLSQPCFNHCLLPEGRKRKVRVYPECCSSQLCACRVPSVFRTVFRTKFPSHLLLLLLLSRFSHVRLCATPETAAHQALLSLGFSRQEHWSGLPFPSPMHESEIHSVVSDF